MRIRSSPSSSTTLNSHPVSTEFCEMLTDSSRE
nr:MAG TPA: hypothetical protein [Caudoviricetes sp.]